MKTFKAIVLSAVFCALAFAVSSALDNLLGVTVSGNPITVTIHMCFLYFAGIAAYLVIMFYTRRS